MAWKFGRVAGQNTVLLGETAMKKTIALVAAIVASTTWADSMTDYCESNAPTDTEYWNSPKDYADNFCALYMHERSKAFSQLNKSIVTNRAPRQCRADLLRSKTTPGRQVHSSAPPVDGRQGSGDFSGMREPAAAWRAAGR